MSDRYLLFGSSRDRLEYLQSTRPDSRVVVVDDPRVLGLKRFDKTVQDYPVVEKVLPVDIYGGRAWLDDIRAEHGAKAFVAVLPGLEYPSVAAAIAAAELKLPGAGADAAYIHRHKERLLDCAEAAGLATPRSRVVSSLRDLLAFEPRGRWVLKPTDRQASVGVQVLEVDADKAAAWNASSEAGEGSHPASLFTRTCLAQDFLDGPEFSVELLLVEGHVVFRNVTGKTVKGGLHPVELGHVVPAAVSQSERDELVDQTCLLVAATGLRTGLVHAEWIVDGTPHLVECAARLPGDSIVELIDLAYGIDLEGAWLAALSGTRMDSLPDHASGAAVIRFLDLSPGRVRKVHTGDLAALAVVRSDLPTVGDEVRDATDSWSRAGELVVTGTDAEDALAKASAALARVEIDVETSIPGRR